MMIKPDPAELRYALPLQTVLIQIRAQLFKANDVVS